MYKSIEKSPFIKLFFPISTFMFPWKYALTQEMFTSKKKANDNIQRAAFKS